ncbi:hypothetical protein ACRAWG_29165 [Methylobacterium sp. P31]
MATNIRLLKQAGEDLADNCGLLFSLAMYVAGKRNGLEYLYADSFMTYAVVIGLTLSYTIERLERSKYLLQRRLEQEKKKLDDYSAWPRQLAVFLRHEVTRSRSRARVQAT